MINKLNAIGKITGGIGLIGITASTVIGLGVNPASATTFNVVTDFSSTQNPNGVWSYGYSTTLGGSFNLYDISQVSYIVPTVNVWTSSVIADPVNNNLNPGVGYNDSDQGFDWTGHQYFQPHQVYWHPGPQGQYSIIRWIAPKDDIYSLNSQFVGMDYLVPTSTDVHILKNNTSLFDGLVDGYGNGGGHPTFGSSPNISYNNNLINLQTGDTIDFIIGVGSNGFYAGDTTGIKATIEVIPEPSNILGAVTALGFGAFLKRQFNKKLKNDKTSKDA